MQLQKVITPPADGIVSLKQGRYLLQPTLEPVPVGCIVPCNEILPVTILSINETEFNDKFLRQKLNGLLKKDDVFCSDFLEGHLILQFTATLSETEFRGAQEKALKSAERDPLFQHLAVSFLDKASSVPSGPYFLYGGYLFEAWKLYDDVLASFQTTVTQDKADPYKFSILNALSVDGYWNAVAVPSRLYSTPSIEKPLAGKRITVKDLFKLEGIRTGLNVRSFLELSIPETETAAYVKRLIDLGAVVVGKTKTTAFAGGESEVECWIDFQCPFNARADGYQWPGGSTTGGGSCLAGYEWLDFSIGSDTIGSIRGPAAAHGLYGLRCSTTGTVSKRGMYPQCEQFDTIGLLARSLDSLQRLASASLDVKVLSERPKQSKLLCPTNWNSSFEDNHIEIVNKFVSVLGKFLQVERSDFSFDDKWCTLPATGYAGKTFQEAFWKTGHDIQYYDAYHVYDGFRATYRKRFGKDPYVGPHVRFLWELGAAITEDRRLEAGKELDDYRKWVTSIMLGNNIDNVENVFLVLPVGSTNPKYRDELTPLPFTPRLGVDTLTFGAWLGVPELVVPVTQIPYKSRVSGVTEQLPVAVSVIGLPGSELSLLNVVTKALSAAGWPVQVEPGRTTFKASAMT